MNEKRRSRSTSRILTLALGMILAIGSLSGCGGGESAEGAKNGGRTVDPATVFEEIASPMDQILEQASGMQKEENEDGSGINVLYAGVTENGYCVLYDGNEDQRGLCMCSFDADGKNPETVVIPQPDDSFWPIVSVTPDGNILVLNSAYDEASETSTWKLQYYPIPAGGKESVEAKWEQTVPLAEDAYPEAMLSSREATVILANQEIYLFGNEDGVQKDLSGNTDSADGYGREVCLDAQGNFLVLDQGEKEIAVSRMEPDTGRLESAGSLLRGSLGDSLFYHQGISSGADEYDFFLTGNDGVYGVKLDGSEPDLILDYIASDLLVTYIDSCAVLRADNMLLRYDDDAGSNVHLLRKSDPDKVDSRPILTLGCEYADTDLRQAVIDFNKGDHGSRVVIRSFSSDEENGADSLNTAIASGNAPDLIAITWNMPVQSYASKGVFEDLEPYLAADQEISEEAFLQNVLDAFRVDGKMYFVVPGVSIGGMMGKKKDFGDSRGVPVRQLEKLIEDRKIGYDTALGVTSRDSVLWLIMYGALDQYVDWEKGTCSFQSEAFTDLLEFTARFPKEINWDKVDWGESEAWMRAGRQLLREAYFYGFDNYMEERYGTIGEEISFMGFPGDGENSPALYGDLQLAMNQDAADKDACWEFLRSFYLDSFQQKQSYSFPVSRKALEAMAEKAMIPKTYTYTDENGKKVEEEIERSINVGGKEYPVPTPSQEDIDFVIHTLESAETVTQIDPQISKIISEESGAFFAGQKSAGEVAEIIQSRVQIYINETK